MSPEQLDGRPVDHRTDVWSLGATAFELLTGQRPFDGATRDGLIEAVLRREPEPLSRLNPRVPRDLQVIVATALTKDANRRYQTAADLAEDLERLRTGRSIRARPAGPLERVRRWAARNPGVAASLAATFVVLVGALVVSTRLLSRTREALDANATLLDEVTQLADAKVAADLLAEAPRLWPAIPSRAPAMDGWLKRARSLEGRVEAHRRALEDVDRRMGSLVAEEFADTADTETHAWMKEQLTEIIASVELLLEEVPRMQARYALAEGLARRSLDEPGAQWASAAARVAADPRFEGFELTPQLGLLPLGPDPDSALEEFAHLQSGQPPQRDVASGRLALAAESSIVLVLVPGGEAGVGCDPPGEGLWEGDPFVDPRARELDGPRHPVRLDPFFISKYELTHGQWVRQTGSGRALYAILPGVAELQPTEQVSFVSCAEVLGQLSLRIPSEAQWEHAARGGTSTVYYTGDEPESLIGHTNLADEGSRNNGGAPRWEYVPWLEDGFHTTAPVGSFLANPYGLHDVVGNVYEWVDAPWLAIDAAPPRDGDGAATHERMKARVVRGGSFAKSDLHGRSGHRDGLPGHLFPPDIGVRPARAVR